MIDDPITRTKTHITPEVARALADLLETASGPYQSPKIVQVIARTALTTYDWSPRNGLGMPWHIEIADTLSSAASPASAAPHNAAHYAALKLPRLAAALEASDSLRPDAPRGVH